MDELIIKWLRVINFFNRIARPLSDLLSMTSKTIMILVWNFFHMKLDIQLYKDIRIIENELKMKKLYIVEFGNFSG